jgi:hypothetical protein
VGDREYPQYLKDKGFRFVERIPGTDKLPIRQASARSTIPEASRLSSGQFANMIHNQRNAIQISTPEQRERGKNWYPLAHQIASRIHPDIETGAGVISALSGFGTSWEENVRSADQFLKTGKPGNKATAVQTEQAARIRDGEHWSTVLPNNLKEQNFTKAIINPHDETIRVNDTHENDLTGGVKQPWQTVDRGLDAIGRYNTITDAGHIAAQREGLPPLEQQATGWLVWKELGHPHRGAIRARDIRSRRR